MLPGQFRYIVGGNSRKIGKGLIELPRQRAHDVERLRPNDELMVIGAKTLRR